MPVSKRLRFEILRRDNHSCRYCGATAPGAILTVDHVIPVALGGTDEPGNLVTACSDCNAGKGSSQPDPTLIEDVAADALRWSTAMQKAAAQREADIAADNDLLERFECIWTRYWLPRPGTHDTSSRFRQPHRKYAPRDADWKTSVRRFVAAGLDLDYLAVAVKTALYESKNVAWDQGWRYFCGICWRELAHRRDIAASIIATDDLEGS